MLSHTRATTNTWAQFEFSEMFVIDTHTVPEALSQHPSLFTPHLWPTVADHDIHIHTSKPALGTEGHKRWVCANMPAG